MTNTADTHDPGTGDGQSLVEIFFMIARRWDLDVAEQQALLGGLNRPTLEQWMHGRAPHSLSLEVHDRIAHIIGIDVATQAFYGLHSPNAASHIRRPCTAPSGEGTALEVMLTGLPGLASVRRHVEQLVSAG